MIKSQIIGDSIFSNSSDAFTLYERSLFGEKKGNRIEYTPIEALFLFQEGKMSLFHSNKELSELSLTKKLKKMDKNIEMKLHTYRDLRKKGYILKSALKFGADFRVYDKGVKPGTDHAK